MVPQFSTAVAALGTLAEATHAAAHPAASRRKADGMMLTTIVHDGVLSLTPPGSSRPPRIFAAASTSLALI